jgi:hypothetical protein
MKRKWAHLVGLLMIALAACTLSSCGDDDGGNANDSGKGITAQYPSWLVGKWYDAEDDATFVFQSNGRGRISRITKTSPGAMTRTKKSSHSSTMTTRRTSILISIMSRKFSTIKLSYIG